TSGATIRLTANYFRILSRPQWVLYQYHVDYKPPMESRRLRSALLFQHAEILGSARSFDGAMLFLPQRLHSKVPIYDSIQLYWILRILNMQQIGRNYYNPSDPHEIRHHRLTVWPGYSSTILHYESSIMMCTDVSHKVLRSETVLDFMVNLRQQCGSQRYTEICAKELIGLIVLTK
ncbi:Piwi-like protein 1, partial [Goodea atripinnis]